MKEYYTKRLQLDLVLLRCNGKHTKSGHIVRYCKHTQGDGALTPKPCLAPESSSKEGSTAVVYFCSNDIDFFDIVA